MPSSHFRFGGIFSGWVKIPPFFFDCELKGQLLLTNEVQQRGLLRSHNLRGTYENRTGGTGIYHLPVLTFLHDKGYFVSVINPFAMKKYVKDNSIKGAKTDKLDSMMTSYHQKPRGTSRSALYTPV